MLASGSAVLTQHGIRPEPDGTQPTVHRGLARRDRRAG